MESANVAERSSALRERPVSAVGAGKRSGSRTSIAGAVFVALVATAVYWRTAYPTINWWDSGQYSLAAHTLGIVGPPGSLMLTLLGWPIAKLSAAASVAHNLNLFAGALAAISAVLVYVVGLRALRIVGVELRGSTALGAALGALVFAFSATLWDYAVQFTPYVLTTVFTGLILLTMMRWWEEADEPHAWRHIAMLGLLFGLDFSVHRTNALLMPGVLLWIAFRRPATLRDGSTWRAGVGCLLAGLALHLLLIPIARTTQSPLFWNDPTNLSRFWAYISLERLGGGFLLGLLPRKSNFFTEQSADLLRAFGDNFFHLDGSGSLLGVYPGLVGLYGLIALWKRMPRFGKAFVCVLLLQALVTVVYFNIPANFFRSLDRHYLPVFVTFCVAIACGPGLLVQRAAQEVRRRRVVWGAMAFGVLLMMLGAFLERWQAHDASKRYFAADYARNVLQSLPPNAIYFTVGDNDTWPILYMQAVEGMRRDVQLVNISLANAPEYIAGLKRRDPSFPLSMTFEQYRAAARVPWTDTTVVLPVAGSAKALAIGTDSVPREIVLHPKPQYMEKMIPGEVVLLDLVRTNAWKRPLTFAVSASEGRTWLEPYSRLDGVFWRVVPVLHPATDPDRLRAALARNEYRGLADSTVIVDDVSRTMGGMYLLAFDALLSRVEANRNIEQCRREKAAMLAAVPTNRVEASAESIEKFMLRCENQAP